MRYHNVFQTVTCLAASLLFAGCATKSYVVLLENPDGSSGQVIIKGAKGEQVIKTAGQGALLDGSSLPAAVDEGKIKQDFAAAMIARPKLPVRYLLYFQAGATLTPESEALIPKIIAEAAERPAVEVSVIGHTDSVGKEEDNEALALKRAETIAELLKSKGLKAHALATESHGERNPLIPTADNTFEPKNRRVEISIR